MTLQCHGGDRLLLSVLGIGDSITSRGTPSTHHGSLCRSEARGTLDTSTTSWSTNSWLGYTLNVVMQDLSVVLCASLSRDHWLVYHIRRGGGGGAEEEEKRRRGRGGGEEEEGRGGGEEGKRRRRGGGEEEEGAIVHFIHTKASFYHMTSSHSLTLDIA